MVFTRALAVTLLATLALTAGSPVAQESSDELFLRGQRWDQFLNGAKAQRELWLAAADAPLDADITARFERASRNLRILIVAEDWCPDSVNAVPYVARLASTLSIPLRIVNREVGAAVMKRHPTPDGRVATPTVVLLRGSREVGAWVERPAQVQAWFRSMATSPDSARLFAARQTWYDADRGRTLLSELTVLAERVAGR
ncbi:MAG: thioredoxin family protein [Vicinamibacterales bacterium]